MRISSIPGLLVLALLTDLSGSRNDTIVLYKSHLFHRLVGEDVLPCNYTTNGHDYTIEHYLDDDIYPSWSTFVRTIQTPTMRKQSIFAQAQEAC
jgi:hypothetical protein